MKITCWEIMNQQAEAFDAESDLHLVDRLHAEGKMKSSGSYVRQSLVGRFFEGKPPFYSMD